MSENKKGKARNIVFIVFIIIFALLFFSFLELSKNTVLGWVLAVIAFCGYVFMDLRLLKDKKFFAHLGIFICFLIVLGGITSATAPPYKRVPAVDIKNPEATGIIAVEQGELTGVFNEDKSVEVYTGIPYAKPPVGNLRWKEPQEPDSWEGVLVCDHFAPMSMQQRNPEIINSLTSIIGYHNYKISLSDNYREDVSEDSLYLNIWKPAGETKDVPVLVYIHGGSLTTGQPSFSEYRGEDLAKQGIIVINFGYRLNVFGYMASDELAEESPNGTTGNYGLLDQIQALKWIQKNIEAFGGDPVKVTIAGESAGSSSVNALCVSPLAKGLFRYAIAESSGILAVQPYHTFRTYEDAINTGKSIFKEFGFSSLDDMRAIPAEELVKTSFANSAMTVDGYAITEQPYLTYEKGENNEQALMNGFNSHEANVFNLFNSVDRNAYSDMLKNIAGDYGSEIEAIYPYDNKPLDYDFLVEAGGEAKGTYNFILGGAWFAYSHYLWSNYAADEGIPVYQYCFTKSNASLQANHAGELPYAYGNLWRHGWLYTEEDNALSDEMQSYWVNFIKTGNPNGEKLYEWQPFESDRSKVLELGENIAMIDNQYNDLYPVLDKYQTSLK